MGSARLASFVWPGMILAGVALAAAVWAAWPEPTVRVVRLPYGEAAPKTPLAPAPVEREAVAAPVVQEEQAAVAPPAARPSTATAAADPPEPVEEEGRVLAAVEPAPTATTEQVDEAWGPDPVPSELDGLKGYEPESPEELGASPLPGFGVTPPPPSAAG